MTGTENHDITLSEASEWTKNFRTANPGAGTTIAHSFSKESISEVLAQTGCVGIRIYYALNDSGQKELILVGVDANDNDITTGKLLDRSFKCPQSCGSANALNS